MRGSTTSAATDRRRSAHARSRRVAAHARSRKVVSAILVTELICAMLLVGRPRAAPGNPGGVAPAPLTTPAAASTTETLDDGRTVHLIGLGGAHTAPLLARIAAQMNDADRAVDAIWGAAWPRDVVIVAAGSDAEFRSLAGGGPDIAATTTA